MGASCSIILIFTSLVTLFPPSLPPLSFFLSLSLYFTLSLYLLPYTSPSSLSSSSLSGMGLSVHLMYLGESSPKKLRGFLTLTSSIFIGLGKVMGQIVGIKSVPLLLKPLTLVLRLLYPLNYQLF